MDPGIDTDGRISALRWAIAAIEGRSDPAARAAFGAGGGMVAMSHDPAPSRADVADRTSGDGARACGDDRAAEWSVGRLTFGVGEVDRRLGPAGGLMLGALHEIRAEEMRDAGAATGFAAALVARSLARRGGRALWITTAQARREGGQAHAPGWAALGLDPVRVVEVGVERPEEALWAFEEGLECAGVAAIVAEIPGRASALDLTATRRLALRASRGGDGGDGVRSLALLVRPAGEAQTTAAATRWGVRAARSRRLGGFALGAGRAAFELNLEKNRDGRPGRFVLEWDSDERRFASLPTPSGAAPAAAGDRPAAPAGGARVVAFERPARGRWGD